MPDFLQRHDFCGLVAAGCAAGCAASSPAASAPCARQAQRERQPGSGRRRDPTPVCSTPASHAKQSNSPLVHLCPPAGPCRGLQSRLGGLLLWAGAVSGAARLRPGFRVARTQGRLAARHSCKSARKLRCRALWALARPGPLQAQRASQHLGQCPFAHLQLQVGRQAAQEARQALQRLARGLAEGPQPHPSLLRPGAHASTRAQQARGQVKPRAVSLVAAETSQAGAPLGADGPRRPPRPCLSARARP